MFPLEVWEILLDWGKFSQTLISQVFFLNPSDLFNLSHLNSLLRSLSLKTLSKHLSLHAYDYEMDVLLLDKQEILNGNVRVLSLLDLIHKHPFFTSHTRSFYLDLINRYALWTVTNHKCTATRDSLRLRLAQRASRSPSSSPITLALGTRLERFNALINCTTLSIPPVTHTRRYPKNRLSPRQGIQDPCPSMSSQESLSSSRRASRSSHALLHVSRCFFS